MKKIVIYFLLFLASLSSFDLVGGMPRMCATKRQPKTRPIINAANGGGFNCMPCAKYIPEIERVRQHIHTNHNKNNAINTCPLCTKKFGTTETLKAHMEKYKRNDKKTPSFDSATKFECILCQEILPRINFQTDFLVHILYAHKKELNVSGDAARRAMFGAYKYLLPAQTNSSSNIAKSTERPDWESILRTVLQDNTSQASKDDIKNSCTELNVAATGVGVARIFGIISIDDSSSDEVQVEEIQDSSENEPTEKSKSERGECSRHREIKMQPKDETDFESMRRFPKIVNIESSDDEPEDTSKKDDRTNESNSVTRTSSSSQDSIRLQRKIPKRPLLEDSEIPPYTQIEVEDNYLKSAVRKKSKLEKNSSSSKGKEKIKEKGVMKPHTIGRKKKPSVGNSRRMRKKHQKKDAHTSESEEYTGEFDYAPTRQVNISQIRRSFRIKQKEEGKMSAVTDGNPCRGLEGTEIHVGDGEVKEVDGKVAEGKAEEIMKDDAVVTNEIVTEEMAKVVCNANDVACGAEKIKITDVGHEIGMAVEANETAEEKIEMETDDPEAGLVEITAEETGMYEGAEEEQSTPDMVKDKGKEIEQSEFDDIDWRGFNDTIVFGGISTLKRDRQPNEEASSSQATAEEPPSTLSSLSTVLEEGKDHETTIIEEFPSTDLGYDYETIYKEEWPGAPTDYMMDFLHIDEIPADYGDEFFDYDHLTRELVAELLKEKGILRPFSYPEQPDPPKTPMMDLNIVYID